MIFSLFFSKHFFLAKTLHSFERMLGNMWGVGKKQWACRVPAKNMWDVIWYSKVVRDTCSWRVIFMVSWRLIVITLYFLFISSYSNGSYLLFLSKMQHFYVSCFPNNPKTKQDCPWNLHILCFLFKMSATDSARPGWNRESWKQSTWDSGTQTATAITCWTQWWTQSSRQLDSETKANQT